MAQKHSADNLDGFIVRRRPAVSQRRLGLDDLRVPKQYLLNPEQKTSSASSQPGVRQMSDSMTTDPIQTAERIHHRGSGVDMVLGDLAIPDKKKKKSRFRLHKPSKRTVKIAAVLIVLAGLAYGGFFAWKLFGNSSKVFSGNPLAAIFSEKELKKDQYGRTNLLLFGTSEDDPNHDGAYLTDSIMIASLSKDKKDAYLLSVPRDLYVQYGQACVAGYQGKINVDYICNAGTGSDGKPKDEQAGQNGLRTMIGNVFGIDLQYSVHVDYTVLRQAVDAVGGITVTIDSPDPRGILDRNFDWDCPGARPQSCYNVKYPNGPVNLDGRHALFLARARGDDGRTYGLAGSNFDREKYQQKILIALKDKATSAGTLANPVAVTNLLDSLGSNVRTNIDSEEVKSFITLVKQLDSAKVKTLTLVDKDKPLVKTGNAGGQSIVQPVDGLYSYGSIQAYVKANISGDAASLENATVAVFNGSGVSGAAQKEANTLTSKGFNVTDVDTAPPAAYGGAISLYDRTAGKKPATLKKLEQTLGLSSTSGALPSTVTSSADFVIILGSNGAH